MGEKGSSERDVSPAMSGDINPADLPFSASGVFEVLAGKRRRQVLSLLDERGGTITVGELAEQVVTGESAAAREFPIEEATHHVRVHLHHAVLPKLSEHGFVEYDEGAVTLTRQAELVRPCLEFAEALEGRER